MFPCCMLFCILTVIIIFVYRYFVEEKPIWEMDSGLVLPSEQFKVDNSVAQYTGGMVQVILFKLLYYLIIVL